MKTGLISMLVAGWLGCGMGLAYAADHMAEKEASPTIKAPDEGYDQGDFDEYRGRVLLHQGSRWHRAQDPCRQEYEVG